VENIMEQHPEVSKKNAGSDGEQKCAGLFLPPNDAGIHTTEEGLQKQASGGIGGGIGTGDAYTMYGESEKRMCPKIRNVVSTFICRYHCLDGLAIDDHQILCGEAIWRQAVMDKFSREYRDADGKWVGGYLNKRFLIEQDDGGHPALLKPGQRNAPIHDDAWSTEKRLQEMRNSESSKRGYSTTPGDPDGLYNFDQHDLAKGPKPQLSEKKRDQIAKNASVKVSASHFTEQESLRDLYKVGPEEGHEPSPTAEELEDYLASREAEEKGGVQPVQPDAPKTEPAWSNEKQAFNLRKPIEAKKGKKKSEDWDPNPWAVCHTTVDKDEDPEKFERCVQDVKGKQAFNLRSRRLAGSGKYASEAINTPMLGRMKKVIDLINNNKGLYSQPIRGGGESSPIMWVARQLQEAVNILERGGVMDDALEYNISLHLESAIRQLDESRTSLSVLLSKELTGIQSELSLRSQQELRRKVAPRYQRERSPEEQEERRKQAFNLRSRRLAGGGKRCPKCRAIYEKERTARCRCGGKMEDYSVADATMATGSLPAASPMTMASLSFANGVYKATRLGKSAFGGTVKEALGKLDENPLQESADDLLKLRQEEDANAGAAQQQPAPVQTQAEPMVAPDPTPSTDEVPPPQPMMDEMLDETGMGEPHVDANEIDEYLATEATAMDEDEAMETEAQASALSLGPDKNLGA
jgi:hypothetical protein